MSKWAAKTRGGHVCGVIDENPDGSFYGWFIPGVDGVKHGCTWGRDGKADIYRHDDFNLVPLNEAAELLERIRIMWSARTSPMTVPERDVVRYLERQAKREGES